jgi:hypothetical protein
VKETVQYFDLVAAIAEAGFWRLHDAIAVGELGGDFGLGGLATEV